MPYWVYILQCADMSYYTGHTDHLERRIAAHQRGEMAGYTRRRRPVTMVFSQEFSSRDQAFEAERRIKGWSRAKKEALLRRDWVALRRLAKAHPSTGSG